MKDKLYKDWQEGMTQAEISAKYNITLHAIKKILNQTPRERTCPVCKTVFVAHKGGRYCSFECCQYYHKRLKNKPTKKKRTTLDDYLKTINVADYGKLQQAETQKVVWGCKMKKDCFGYDDGKCTALKKLYCKSEKCKFYKTKEQYTADQKKAEE